VKNLSTNLFFKATETGVFWKQMPAAAFVFREEKRPLGFRSTKDHLSSNTTGDCRLKFLVVHHSAVPHTVCGYRKTDFSVVWCRNWGTWVMQDSYIGWW